MHASYDVVVVGSGFGGSITGHSLGGAMSALMAVMLMREPAYASVASKLRAVYTFGQPTIGTRELAAACDGDPDLRDKVLRYVYGRTSFRIYRHGTPADSPTSAENTGTTAPGSGSEATGRRHNSGTPRKSSKRPSRPSRASSRCYNVPFRYKLEDHLLHRYVSALTPPGIRTKFGDYYLAEER